MRKKSFIAVIAVMLSVIFALTGCAQKTFTVQRSPIVDISTGSATDILDDNDAVSPAGVTNTDNSPHDSILVDTGEIIGIDKYEIEDNQLNLEKEIERDDVYGFGLYEIAYKLSSMGYDVYRGVAVVNDNQVLGLLYTDYEIYSGESYTCGFIQVIEEGKEPILNDKNVVQGVVAVADSETLTNAFIVNRYVSLEDSSGIIGDYYFTSKQVNNYAIQISVEDSSIATYDEDIDAINYNTGKTMWKAKTAPEITFDALSLYTADEQGAYDTALKVMSDIVSLQNKNAAASERYTLVIIDTAILESIILNEQNGLVGTESGDYYNIDALSDVELEANQMLMVTATEGVKVLTVPTEEELQAAADSRAVKGFLQTLTSVLMIAGSVCICVATWGAATPAVVGVCVVSGAIATTYAVSNLVEGVQDLYYGLKGDVTTVAKNPVRDMMADVIGDEELASKIYHGIGISASILQSLMIPTSAGMAVAQGMGAGVGRTIWIVTRAVGIEVIKMAVTATAATFVSIKTSEFVAEQTGSEALGQLVGYVGAMLTGYITYRGLDIIDHKFNFAGIYRTKLGTSYTEILQTEKLLKRFNEKTWSGMTDNQRKDAIEKLAATVAKRLGLDDVPEIEIYNSATDNTYGWYDHVDNKIGINEYYFENGSVPSWRKVVETVSHEMRHAYQHKLLAQGVLDEITENLLPGHYIESGPDYFRQPCEVDARDYGSQWVELLMGILGL